MEFRLLGPVEVISDDGKPVALTQPRLRAVLCVFLLNAGQVLTPERLVADVWGHQRPADPRGTVINYVSRISRGLLLGGRLRPHALGYRLDLLDGDVFDLHRFRDIAEAGRQATARRDFVESARLLQQALALWRGPPLGGVSPSDTMAHLATYLAEQRQSAEERLIGARLALGHHRDVIGPLRGMVAADPLRERPWALLMLACYRSGKKAEALDAYMAARAALASSEITPGQELRKLHGLILRDDPGLTLPAPPGGKDRTQFGQPRRPHYSTAASRRAGALLPPAVRGFTGRTSEITRLLRLLDPPGGRSSVPVAVISGPPGCGKTCLAVHVAHSAAPAFPDGQLFLELAASSGQSRDPRQVLGAALQELSVPAGQIPEKAPERAALFRSRLAGRKMLVLIDDAADAGDVGPLLPGDPSCAVIVTSRARLSALAGAVAYPIGCLSPDEALDMLASIAGEGVRAEAPATELVAACGLLPLAIRIAGAKVAGPPALPVADVAARVADEKRRLDELELDDIGVRAAVTASYTALGPKAQRAFRRLSLARGNDFAEWAIAAALGDPDAGAVTGTLVEQSLLTPVGVDATGEQRYRLEPLLRDYAAERYAEEPQEDRDAALSRVLTAALELADLAEAAMPRVSHFPPPVRPGARTVIPESTARRLTADPWAWFGSEQANLVAGVEWACAAGHYHTAARLAACQAAYQFFTGRGAESERLWRRIVAAAGAAGDRAAQAHAQYRLATIYQIRGHVTQAAALVEDCIPALVKSGDRDMLAWALYWRAFCAAEQQDHRGACQHARRGLRLAREVGDQHAEAMILRVLGKSTAHLGSHEAGTRLCEQAVSLARQCGGRADVLLAEYDLAEVWIHTGQAELAAEISARELASDTFRSAGSEGFWRDLAGRAQHALGRYGEAISEFSRAADVFEEQGVHYGQAMAQAHLGRSYMAAGDYAAAQRYFKQSLPTFQRYGWVWYERQALDDLTACQAAARGDGA